MKKIHILSILAILLAMFVIMPSCKDDKEDINNGQDPDNNSDKNISEDDKAVDPYGKATEKAMALYSIVCQVSDIDSLPDDWETAKYTANISDRDDEEGSLTQTVATETAAQAIARWNSLTGQSLKSDATTGTWSYEGIGSMTLSIENQSDRVATIEIQIPQLQLERINFVPASKLGTNASTFTPYYEYGDVVKDKDGCYWGCVRPANFLKSKKKSHWMSFQLVSGNYKTYKANSNRGEHIVPTGLDKDEEKMTYFAELLDILVDPANYENEWWGKSGGRGQGVCDLDNGLYTPAYMKALAKLWDSKGIWGKVTGSIGKQYFTDAANNQKLTFFYSGYSSPMYVSTMTLWTATYEGKTLSNPQKSELKWDMKAENKNDKLKSFDIHEYVETGKRGNKCTQGPDMAVVVRVREYSGDKEKKLSWAVEDVLTTKDVQKEATAPTKFDAPKVGCIIGANRTFYATIDDAINDNTDPLGLVVYVSKNGNGKNLAMALEDAGMASWSSENNLTECTVSKVNATNEISLYQGVASGSTDGSKLSGGCGHNHTHEAAEMASNYQAYHGDATRWFLPSTSDVLKTFPNSLIWGTNNFYYMNEELTRNGWITKYYHNMFKAVDPSYDKGDLATITFWTSTIHSLSSGTKPIRVQISTAGFIFEGLDAPDYSAKLPVRPFMEF